MSDTNKVAKLHSIGKNKLANPNVKVLQNNNKEEKLLRNENLDHHKAQIKY